MASTPVTDKVITLPDFMQAYQDEGPFEWVNGEKQTLSPQVARSGRVPLRLARKLSDHIEAGNLGEAFVETPFVITSPDNPDWVTGSRVPDVMFVSASRLAALSQSDPAWEDKPLPLVPDLAVEIISSTDRFASVAAKVEGYLKDGVRLVWLINPELRSVTVYTAGSSQQSQLGENQSLSGGDLLPGFSMPVADLFTQNRI